MTTKLEQEIIDIQLDCAKRITNAIRRALFGDIGRTLPTVKTEPVEIKEMIVQTATQRTADRLRRMLQIGGWTNVSSIRGTLNVSDKVFRNACKIVSLERRRIGAMTEYRLKMQARP
jgi:hypothetical protein